MNNLRITLDGRVTAWSTQLTTYPSVRASAEELPPELELFHRLPDVGKAQFLELTMGLSNVVNSDTDLKDAPRARRGSKGISVYGRSQVRCAAQYLEDTFGVKNLSFLTCTLPPEALADYTPETWAEVVHRFHKSLSYHLKKRNQRTLLVAVTEIQMNRWEAEQGLPPVHLHLVFPGRAKTGQWCFRPRELQALWVTACQSVWASRWTSESSCRVESIRKSSVNYLGKYMSKGVDALNKLSPETLPTGWYSISTKLKRFIKKLEFKVSGEFATKIYRFLRGSSLMQWEVDVTSYNPDTGYLWHQAWLGGLISREVYHELMKDFRDFLGVRNSQVAL